MDLLHGLGSLPTQGETAVTIGFFDGVHRGHQSVMRRVVDVARDRGLRSVVVTFDRHPREVLTPDDVPRLLTTTERKAALVEALGVDAMLVMEFDPEIAAWEPERFVREVLVEGLGAKHASVGTNFTFGHKAAGNVEVLADLGSANGFTVEGVSLLKIDGRRVSSTSVREALAAGDLDWPEAALGRHHVVDGTVVAGAGRGEDLGWPTANLRTDPRLLLPGRGVYAGRARVREGEWTAAINVGVNPTFGEEPMHIEAFLLGFEGDLLGEPIAVEFWHRLRDEERFDTPEALARQIGEDVERTRSLVEG